MFLVRFWNKKALGQPCAAKDLMDMVELLNYCDGLCNLGRLKGYICNVLAYNGGIRPRVNDTFVILYGHNDAGWVEDPPS